jgi:LysR family transcriptional activator of dmlA
MDEPSSNNPLAKLPHLPTFVRAAERSSFTAAAAELGISQAAVSQRIAVLEKAPRVSLFARRAGKIAFTDLGQRLYAYAQKILDRHEQAQRELSGIHPEVAGERCIAASSVPGECFLPALLTAVREKHPFVHVRANVGDSASVLKDVEKEDAALGIVGQKVDSPSLEARAIPGAAP